MELVSHEHGGSMRKWNHAIRIKFSSQSTCHYVDDIDIHAGLLTPLVWLYAQVFYCYRQLRWVRLLRALGG